ncbi:HNH endonuclease family protein [Pseudoclavibacter sp. RFBG4]|uniref:HNH endonuclease family protein n=1 Tax=Pseudoclavibacter sp. RFBG4 TaxID=2080575 RepID=UPI001C668797|nr:HNH endonuclease family protein [Pseudoclavibacter sp. RFBG4]
MPPTSSPTARRFVHRSGRPALAAAALIGVAVLLAGCTPLAPQATSPADGSTASESSQLVDLAGEVEAAAEGDDPTSFAADALDVLGKLEVAPRDEWQEFDREGSFGEGWQDPDGNGCDARNDALAASMTEVNRNRDGCRVDTGVFVDPYSGDEIDFQRGPDTSPLVQIDHVVALANAWRTGAKDLSFEERVELSNDPMNLQATAGWVNDDKKSQDAANWLPPRESYHCTYVARQIVVKATYSLWVTQAEHDAMRDVLEDCA